MLALPSLSEQLCVIANDKEDERLPDVKADKVELNFDGLLKVEELVRTGSGKSGVSRSTHIKATESVVSANDSGAELVAVRKN